MLESHREFGYGVWGLGFGDILHVSLIGEGGGDGDGDSDGDSDGADDSDESLVGCRLVLRKRRRKRK